MKDTDASLRLRATFQQTFGEAPDVIARAPGRVNLIGEHTDYNDGFVLPVAIDREVRVAMKRRPDRRVRLVAANFGRRSEFSVDDIEHDPSERWSHYERGVALMLKRRGYELGGFDAVLEGDVPPGAGLSSSAAVEVATGTALRALFDLDIDPVQLALLGQEAENEFVGVSCGIMDQFISALGKRDRALFLDCRSLETQHVPIEGDVQIVVSDTSVKRGLVDSAYNQRRSECSEATAFFAARFPEVRALRDVTPERFARFEGDLPQTVCKRARHVVSENERVLASVRALTGGDLEAFGHLMYASHASLRDDYEVTIPQLDALVEIASAVPGVLGARMTGAGFGGCTVSLVRDVSVNPFRETVHEQYRAKTGLTPKIHVCRVADGASVVRL
jgi:galactokinase